MEIKKYYIISEIEQPLNNLGINRTFITQCIEYEWIRPEAIRPARHTLSQLNHFQFADEDIARIKLIHELKEEFGVNNESIPIILHLLDQLYTIFSEAKKSA